MELQAIIFDVDGTVAETADLHRAAFNRAFDEHGLSWHWDREIYSQLAPVEFSLAKLRLFAAATRQSGYQHGPSHTDIVKISTRKAQIFCQMAREGKARLRPGVARLMQESLHEGLLLGAVSTSSRAETHALLSATLGFQGIGWITSLKTAEDTPIDASKRPLFQSVLDDFAIQPHRAVAIDDSVKGANSAVRAGIAVLVTPSMYTASHRFEMASVTLSDLGHPTEPFTVINGETMGHTCVSPAMLRQIIGLKAAAA